MASTTLTHEEFDARLAQSTEQMRQKRLALEVQVAKLEELVVRYSAVLERQEAGLSTEADKSLVARLPSQFGAGRHLLSGAGIDVDALMAVSIDDMFADYVPDDAEESKR